jgi:hypothetical protein
MQDIAAITVGTSLVDFSALAVINARNLKGDLGYGKLASMYMNSTTLNDILVKQDAGTITKELIKEVYGKVSITTAGVTTTVDSDTPEYRYNGVTPIVIDDALSTGVITLVEKGAFAFAQKDLTNPLMYVNDPKTGNGAGKEEWGTKSLYILHPIGFSFIGVIATNYASRSGLTIAELQAGGLYELKVDAKLAPITNIVVKIG